MEEQKENELDAQEENLENEIDRIEDQIDLMEKNGTGNQADIIALKQKRLELKEKKNLLENEKDKLELEEEKNELLQRPADLISESKAKNIALTHAGFSDGSVKGLECELDKKKSGYVYEVEFETMDKEYEHDIDARTGKIIKFYSEIDD